MDVVFEIFIVKCIFYMLYKLVVGEIVGIIKVKMVFDGGVELYFLGNSSKECIYMYLLG